MFRQRATMIQFSVILPIVCRLDWIGLDVGQNTRSYRGLDWIGSLIAGLSWIGSCKMDLCPTLWYASIFRRNECVLSCINHVIGYGHSFWHMSIRAQ